MVVSEFETESAWRTRWHGAPTERLAEKTIERQFLYELETYFECGTGSESLSAGSLRHTILLPSS